MLQAFENHQKDNTLATKVHLSLQGHMHQLETKFFSLQMELAASKQQISNLTALFES